MAYSPETLRQIANAQTEFVWEMQEYEHRPRTAGWYIVVSLIALVCVIYGVFASNYLFALIILISAVILILAGNDKPEKVLIQIGKNGVVIDGEFTEFDKLANFSIIYHPPYTKIIYMDRKYSPKPRIKLYLDDQDPIALRNHLLSYLPENLTLRDEHFSDILGRLLRI